MGGKAGTRALLFLLSALLILPSPAFAKKERIVVMKVQGPGLSSADLNSYRAAVVQGLGEKYEVLSGDQIDAKVNEIFKKESKKAVNCDTEKCFQDIAIAFQAELIAVTTVVKKSGGYILTLQINNVSENKNIFSKSIPCRNCDEFSVIDQLKVMAGGEVSKLVSTGGSSSGTGATAGRSPTGMVFVKGGCFDMGDTFGDGGDKEKPVHRVCLDDFYMDRYEVTNKEFEKFKPGFKESRGVKYDGKKVSSGDNNPVVNVTWFESKEYCESLGKRLPTEAEWEYAAREGGKKVRFGTGKDTIGSDEANFDSTVSYKKPYSHVGGWREKTLPVGSFQPNGFGLYDMSGNVWEWVNDRYGKDYYGRSPTNNPTGSDSGTYRVLRGGSWNTHSTYLRASIRLDYTPDDRFISFGFRCSQ